MDAISFVLGVKSSQLRSAQLKELIYSGRSRVIHPTDSLGEELPQRGHVAALYVTDEGKEIRFMRSILSNGTSEYKINRRNVLHTEYNRVLEQQNILVRARNFLVFQGDVEAVASQSAKDLTRLIEYISGSWEFKVDYEKLKAEQDLATENSTFNLNKRRGITNEMKEYRDQKAELDQYEQLTQGKNQLISHHLLWKLFHVEQNISSLEQELDSNYRVIEERYGLQQTEEAELKDARRDQARVYRDLVKLEKRVKQCEIEVEQEKPSVIRVDEKISYSDQKVTRDQDNLTSVQQDLARQKHVVQTLERELANVDRAAQRFEAQWQEKVKQRGPHLDEHSLSEYHRLKEQVAIRTVQVQQQLEHLQRTQKTQAEATARLQEQKEEYQTRKDNLQETQRGLTQYLDKLTQQLQQVELELEETTGRLQRFQTDRQRIRQTEVEANEKLTGILNKLAQARVDKRESERERKMKECLESLKRIFPGVYGRVGGLCRPNQRKYDAAVAIALSRHLDAIVVDKQSTAIECIRYMKEQRAGQATFLPLDNLISQPVQEKLRSLAKGAHLALDVLQFESTVEKAMQFACGNTLICDSQKVAKYICYELKQEVKAVALDGTVIHKTGMITGGAPDSNVARSQQRWEDKELENLTKAKEHLVAQLNDLAREKRKLHSDEQLQSQITGLQTRQRFAQEEERTVTRKRENIERELEHVDRSLREFTQRHHAIEQQLHNLDEQLQTIQDSIAQVEDRVFKDFCGRIGISHIREYEEHQVRFSEKTAELRLKFSNQQSKLHNQILFENQQLQSLQDRVTRIESVLEEDRRALADLRADKAQREAKLADIHKNAEALRANIARVKAQYDAHSEKVAAKKKSVTVKLQELDQLANDSTTKESLVQKYHVERASVLRRCKLEEVALPLLRGSLDKLSLEESDLFREPDEMDLDSSDDEQGEPMTQANRFLQQRAHKLQTPQQRAASKQRASQWSIEVDFSSLTKRDRDNGGEDAERRFTDQIRQFTKELEQLAPNMHAYERLGGVELKLRETEREFEEARQEAKAAKERFNAIKQKRYDRFYRAYSHIAEKIDQIYKDLTKSTTFPLGGTAYLSLEDGEEPYLQGVKYHAMPPMKRFRDMEQLSGGEKTVAALALLFAIHSYQPSPFFVLDEVDAALDNANVAKVANYIREHCGDNFQFIVISLKQSLYEKAQSLVGIYREQTINSSQTLTIDLEKFPE
ncbi:Structural maintenance of chromosomes protein 1 [Dispira simplex]|nr:Structural maintenance of chromosomes protein 1 [Dispira simplex]